MAGMYCLKDLLGLVTREGAMELRLEAGMAPMMLLRGHWRSMDAQELTSDEISVLFSSFAAKERAEELRRCGDTQFSHTFPDADKYSVSASLNGEKLSINLKRLGP